MHEKLTKPSPFFDKKENWILDGDHCFVYKNDFPIIKGHAQILPKREIEQFDEMSKDEWLEVQTLTQKYIKQCEAIGFNIAHNSGLIAGQSVAHIHFHVFPHFQGSEGMPKGGYGAAFGHLPDYYKR